jgi:undecaprenyl-diphosphatase
MEWILELDKQIFLAINGWHNELWDGIMWWISGKTTWWPFYLVLLAFMAWKRKWQLVPILLFIILVITLADQTSVHLFKNVFERLRPCHEPSLDGLVHQVNNKCGGQFGFISSHAANSFAVAFFVFLWIKKGWFTALMVSWAGLVAYSRVYLGVHYPGDVIAGAIWGAGCGIIIFLLSRWILSKLPENWWIVRGSGTFKS